MVLLCLAAFDLSQICKNGNEVVKAEQTATKSFAALPKLAQSSILSFTKAAINSSSIGRFPPLCKLGHSGMIVG